MEKLYTDYNIKGTLTSNLDELGNPKSLEFHQQTDYPTSQEFVALKAFQSQQG